MGVDTTDGADIEWNLSEHGAGDERKWGPVVGRRFPNYEIFWRRHVVPLTYRVSDPKVKLLRSAVRSELGDLATSNFGVFRHLVGCHVLLAAGPDAFGEDGVYNFYSRLYSAGCAGTTFLSAVGKVLREYGGVYIPDTRRRIAAHGAPGLWNRFNEALETRTKDYRGQQVHDWGFPILDGRIPKREYLSRWIRKSNKGLGELDAFLQEPNATSRIAEEFVAPVPQAEADLFFVERVLDELWEMALKELGGVKETDRYEEDQAAGATDPPPKGADTGASSSLVIRLR